MSTSRSPSGLAFAVGLVALAGGCASAVPRPGAASAEVLRCLEAVPVTQIINKRPTDANRGAGIPLGQGTLMLPRHVWLPLGSLEIDGVPALYRVVRTEKATGESVAEKIVGDWVIIRLTSEDLLPEPAFVDPEYKPAVGQVIYLIGFQKSTDQKLRRVVAALRVVEAPAELNHEELVVAVSDTPALASPGMSGASAVVIEDGGRAVVFGMYCGDVRLGFLEMTKKHVVRRLPKNIRSSAVGPAEKGR